MPQMILNRNKVLVSTKGHSVAFVKGEETYVPAVIVEEAMAIGAELIDKDETPFKDEQTLALPPEGAERAEKIKAAMLALKARNDRGDFTGSGLPDLKTIIAIVGFNVDSKERNKLWEELLEQLRDAEGA